MSKLGGVPTDTRPAVPVICLGVTPRAAAVITALEKCGVYLQPQKRDEVVAAVEVALRDLD